MGRLYMLGKVYDRSAAAYSRYVQIVPDDLDALVDFTKVALETRQYNAAHEAAKKAFSMDSTRTDVRLLLARSAYQDRDKERAAQLYATVADTTLYEPIDYVRLGQIAFESKDFETGRRRLNEGIARDSTNVEAYFTLGILELQSGKPEAAIPALQKASELAPSFSPAPLNLGIAYLQAKRTEEGIAALRQAQSLAPENPQVLISLAQALVSADSVTAAVTEYRRALDIEPTNTKALRGLGFCHLKRQSYGEAVTALKEATAADAGNADGWAMLGQAYLGLNDVPRARQAAEKALAINPNHPTAKSVMDVSKQAQSVKVGQ
jgi:cytochrome c-type biogenesis protein CcmH/NrfG